MIGGNCRLTPRKSAGEELVRVVCGALETVVLRKIVGDSRMAGRLGRVDVRY